MDSVNAAIDAAKEEDTVSSDNDSSQNSSRYGSAMDLSLLSGDGEARGDTDKASVELEPKPAPITNPDDVDFMAAFDKLASESYQVMLSFQRYIEVFARI